MNKIINILKDKKSIPLDQFINISLYDKKFGYYMTKNPIGERGDFITAPFCHRCAVPLTVASAEETHCAHCLLDPPFYEQTRAVFSYSAPVKRLVLRFKNAQMTALTRFMGHYMAQNASELIESCDFIVPVPLHAERLKARGFNQATLLAYELARSHRHKVAPFLLARKKKTSSKAGLSAEARRKNVENAFEITRPKKDFFIQNKKILLVDDVMTTGATLNACAQALCAAGASQVNVVVFSRAVR